MINILRRTSFICWSMMCVRLLRENFRLGNMRNVGDFSELISLRMGLLWGWTFSHGRLNRRFMGSGRKSDSCRWLMQLNSQGNKPGHTSSNNSEAWTSVNLTSQYSSCSNSSNSLKLGFFLPYKPQSNKLCTFLSYLSSSKFLSSA